MAITINNMPIEDYLRKMEFNDDDIVAILQEGIKTRIEYKKQLLEYEMDVKRRQDAELLTPDQRNIPYPLNRDLVTIPKELPTDKSVKYRQEYVLSIYRQRTLLGTGGLTFDKNFNKIREFISQEGLTEELLPVLNTPNNEFNILMESFTKFVNYVSDNQGTIRLVNTGKPEGIYLTKLESRYLIRKQMENRLSCDILNYCPTLTKKVAILAYIFLDKIIPLEEVINENEVVKF